MKKTTHFLSLFVLCFFFGIQTPFAQVKVGNNATNINATALLELEASNKGLLLPRLSTLQRDSIDNPALGLIIYNTTTHCINYYVGPNWFEDCGRSIPPALSAALGSTFTAYSNGSENFSSNGTCQNKLISAGYSLNTCSGHVVIGANTYPVVLINGQCWMQSNLKEAPTAPCAAAINTGCNVWFNTTSVDLGRWGYNSLTTNGTAGWGTIELAANEGLLYQWSAAMNGSTTERAQGVCPTGWHIPSDCEWMYLEHGQGMIISQQTTNNAWRNTTSEGNKLRGVGGSWNNSSGFTALLAGGRFTSGTFGNYTLGGNWWTSTQADATNAQRRYLSSGNGGVSRGSLAKANAYSVRCLRD